MHSESEWRVLLVYVFYKRIRWIISPSILPQPNPITLSALVSHLCSSKYTLVYRSSHSWFTLMAFLSNTGTPTLSLSPVSGSFPFQLKYIPFLIHDSKIILGWEPPDTGSGTRPTSPSNSWFAPSSPSFISPLPVSSSHCEVWWDGRQVG